MEVIQDVQTVSEVGFNEFLTRSVTGDSTLITLDLQRYTDANNFVGGIIGNQGILYLGSKQVRLDGKNKRIVINDGNVDRVIIGYLD